MAKAKTVAAPTAEESLSEIAALLKRSLTTDGNGLTSDPEPLEMIAIQLQDLNHNLVGIADALKAIAEKE